MAGPHPVVGVAAELTHRRGRSADQTHVLINNVNEHNELVAVEHAFHLGFVVGAFNSGFLELGGFFSYGAVAFGFAHVVLEHAHNLRRYVLDTDKYGGCGAGVGQFLVLGVSPETVAQVVVFHGGVGLNHAIAAVVVGA